MIKSFFGCLAVFAATMTNLQAELVFENKVISLKPSPGDEKAQGTFQFKNVSSSPVEIREVTPSCGCTTATLEKKTFAPGESGSISAVFTIGELSGLQSKSITIKTDEKSGGLYLLSLNADIAEYYSINRRLLFWRHDESLQSKSAEVTYGTNRAVRLLAVVDSSGKFKTEIQEAGDHRTAKIIVTPLIADFQQGELTMTFSVAEGKTTKASLFVRKLPAPVIADPLKAKPPSQPAQ